MREVISLLSDDEDSDTTELISDAGSDSDSDPDDGPDSDSDTNSDPEWDFESESRVDSTTRGNLWAMYSPVRVKTDYIAHAPAQREWMHESLLHFFVKLYQRLLALHQRALSLPACYRDFKYLTGLYNSPEENANLVQISHFLEGSTDILPPVLRMSRADPNVNDAAFTRVSTIATYAYNEVTFDFRLAIQKETNNIRVIHDSYAKPYIFCHADYLARLLKTVHNEVSVRQLSLFFPTVNAPRFDHHHIQNLKFKELWENFNFERFLKHLFPVVVRNGAKRNRNGSSKEQVVKFLPREILIEHVLPFLYGTEIKNSIQTVFAN